VSPLGGLLANHVGLWLRFGVKAVEYNTKWDHHLVPGS